MWSGRFIESYLLAGNSPRCPGASHFASSVKVYLSANSDRVLREELDGHAVADLEMQLEEILKRLVAEHSRGRVPVRAPGHAAGCGHAGVTEKDFDRPIVVREKSLEVDRDIEKALRPVGLFEPQLEDDHLSTSVYFFAAFRRGAQTAEETAALQEKANQQHHRILSHLCAALTVAGWQQIQEIPAAVDLWATRPNSSCRVIFEVKGLSQGNEIAQCRAALSQLLEYRFFYGTDDDRLCLVVDRPITDRRRAVLESMGVGVMVVTESGQLQPAGQLAIDITGAASSNASPT